MYNISSAVVISVVESTLCSSKTLQKGSRPYAPLDEALRYGIRDGGGTSNGGGGGRGQAGGIISWGEAKW